MIVKDFNIHGLVRIRMETTIKSKADIAMRHFRHFEVDRAADASIDIFIHDYCECPSLENGTVTSETCYADNYLNIADEKLCLNLIDAPLTVYCNRYVIPLKFLVEAVLLKRGYSLIHSAALEYRGRNYLFPAFGGVGKTVLASAVIGDGGKLFGDDMVIVSQGCLSTFPLDFSLYPYHLHVLKIEDPKVTKSLRRIEALNRCARLFSCMTAPLRRYDPRMDRLLSMVIRFIATRFVSVSPVTIFGSNCIAQNGPLHRVCYLSKVQSTSSQIMVETIDAEDLAERCANIMFQEWYQSMSILYRYSGLSTFSLNGVFAQIREVFQDTFGRVECLHIRIPNTLDHRAYQSQLIAYLSDHASADMPPCWAS